MCGSSGRRSFLISVFILVISVPWVFYLHLTNFHRRRLWSQHHRTRHLKNCVFMLLDSHPVVPRLNHFYVHSLAVSSNQHTTLIYSSVQKFQWGGQTYREIPACMTSKVCRQSITNVDLGAGKRSRTHLGLCHLSTVPNSHWPDSSSLPSTCREEGARHSLENVRCSLYRDGCQ